MHILVTGGCGFIGSHIVEHHIEKGDEVFVVDDLSTGSIQNISQFQNNPKFRLEEADILTWDGIHKAAAWADRIYHMAAVVGVYRVIAEPIKVLATNILGCERLLRAAQASSKKPRILLASSSEVYGPGHGTNFKETDDLIVEAAAQNRWNYAVSKIADEAFGLSYARSLGLPITLLRLFNTVGPRQTGRYGMVVPRFIKQAVNGEPITVFGDGKQTRSFGDVRDVVQALDIIAQKPACIGEIMNMGNDHEITINNLAELIRKKASSSSAIQHVPYEKAYGEAFVDIKNRKPNLEKFFKLTGFKHQWTLEKTIEDLISKARQSIHE